MYIVTEQNMPEMGKVYLRKLLNNMRHPEAIVRFGTQGNGYAPNYEIKLPNGTVLTYRGLSHERNAKDDKYKNEHLSKESFKYSDIEKALATAG